MSNKIETYAKPIMDFKSSEYLGKWYEQARTKVIPFERENDEDVRATYTLFDENTIKVFNRSFRNNSEI